MVRMDLKSLMSEIMFVLICYKTASCEVPRCWAAVLLVLVITLVIVSSSNSSSWKLAKLPASSLGLA